MREEAKGTGKREKGNGCRPYSARGSGHSCSLFPVPFSLLPFPFNLPPAPNHCRPVHAGADFFVEGDGDAGVVGGAGLGGDGEEGDGLDCAGGLQGLLGQLKGDGGLGAHGDEATLSPSATYTARTVPDAEAVRSSELLRAKLPLKERSLEMVPMVAV